MHLVDLHEAKIGRSYVGAAMSKVISYLEKAIGEKFRRLGTEHFKNSKGTGWGERFQIGDSLKCVRFNWVGSKSSEIESIDFWLGNKHDPNFHITVKGISFVKSLPQIATVLKAPKLGKFKIAALTEAKKGEFTPESAVADMVSKLEAGRSFNRSEFIVAYHVENAHAYDDFVEKYKDRLVINGKRISLPKGEKLASSGKVTKGPTLDGEVNVEGGGSGEEYEVEVPEDDHVSYSESLEHLEGLTQGLINGAFNALFVAGKGGSVFGGTEIEVRFE